MPRELIRTILCVLLWGFSVQLSAQKYGYVQYNSSSGAPFEHVTSVVQDRAGYMWIGSENGLYRFDGVHYELYSLHTESQFIHQLQPFGHDLLFVNDLGIYQITNLDTTPEVITLLEGTVSESDSLPFYPNNLVVDRQGSIWISQSSHTIGRLDDGNFSTFRFSDSEEAHKLGIQVDVEGRIWVLSPQDGLFRFNSTNDSFEKVASTRGGNSLLIHDNQLLIGNSGLHVYRILDRELKLENTIMLDEGSITAMHVDQQDQYFIGTTQGNLYKFQDLIKPPQTIYGANEAHRVEKLDFGQIHEIYVDTDSVNDHNRLWIGSETGLWLLQQRFFKTVEDLPMNNPIGIAIGDQNNAWVPMNYLYEITPEKEDFFAENLDHDLQANAVAHDQDGYLWVSTTTPRVQLLKYDQDKVIARYDFHERGEAIFVLYPDSKGNLWFCQAPVDKPIVGIAQITADGQVKYYGEQRGFTSRVLAIKESSRGEIYTAGIGEDSYLHRYDPEQDRFVNLSPTLPFNAILNFEAHDLTVDNRGVVWLATTDGLLRYDSEKISLIQNDVFGQEEVRGVTHFSNNNIWVATATKGLVFHQQNTSTALGELEGLPAVISAYRCITTDAEGRLWAGTAEGLVYSRISASTLPRSHPPKFRAISIDEHEWTGSLVEGLKIEKSKTLQFQFTNLSYPARNVEYQYRVLPAREREIMLEEQLWQFHGKENILRLSDIEPGEYYLELRARQPGGYQWSKSTELRFSVFLPWYQQPWFLYSFSGLFLLLIGYYLRFYMKRRFQRLQMILKSSNERLADKEAQLLEKIREFEEQKEALASAHLNIQTLEVFINEIPKNASWNDIVNAMGKAVGQSTEINAFEIAFMEDDEIIHRGYSDQERSGYTFRSKPFNVKTSLTCWAMANHQEVLIHDFEKEHDRYIEEKQAYRFRSLLFIPFTLGNDQPVVLCAYSTHKNYFDSNDLIMFRILAQFIHLSFDYQLTKHV